MGDYIISACSTADLTKEQFEKFDIKHIYFHYYLDDVQYPDDLGQTMSFDEFYKRMAEGSDTRTSQVNVDEFVDFFTPFLEEGKDIIHLTLSSGISGVYNSAMVAKQELEEQFPDRKIIVIDSLCASAGYGLLMAELAERRDAGATIEELETWTRDNLMKMHHWVMVTDLKYLVKGGRLSKTSGFLGSMLNICPIINVNNEGKLIAREKIRTKKKCIKRMVELMEEHAEGGLEYSGKCYISQSACMEDARAVADLIEEKFPKLNGKVVINSIGTVIGSHTGPGTTALFFWGDERTE